MNERAVINTERILIGEGEGIAPERTRFPARITLLSGQSLRNEKLGDKATGRFVIDLDSVSFAPTIVATYNHDDAEVVGIGENIRVEDGRLVCDGWIIPFRPGDRAEEIVFRSRQGTPYEASIEFPPLASDIEEIAAGEVVRVNGDDHVGPIRVYRNVPVRAYTVCPTGNDPGSETAVLSQKKETLKAMNQTGKPSTKTPLAKLSEEESQQTGEGASRAHPDLDELISLFGPEIGLTMYQDGVDVEEARKVSEFNEKYGIVPVPAAEAETAELDEDSATTEEPKKEEEPKSETAALKAELTGLKSSHAKLISQFNKLSARLFRSAEADGVSAGRQVEKEKKELSPKEQFLQGFASRFGK